jgi:hypothetical protein
LLQLKPTIPVNTPRGPGFAHVLIDMGQEHHLLWVVFLDSGECWTFRNPEIRLQANSTMRTGLPHVYPETDPPPVRTHHAEPDLSV